MDLNNYEIGKYVDLLNDRGFKHVFGKDSNKDILIAFLNEVIPDRKIIDLEHIRNEQEPQGTDNKKSIFDLYCKTDNGDSIVVELQKESQKDFIERSIYYSSFPIQNQVEKGNEKYTFNAVYIINILNFKLEELTANRKVVSTYRLKELAENTILTDKYTLVYIELPKFTKELDEIEPNNILEGFFYCFRHMKMFENKPQKLKQPIWTRLFNAAQFAAMNKHEQLKYINEMNTARDIRNQIDYAREQGIEQGKALGKAEGKAEEQQTIARNLKRMGIDSATIAESTRLPIEEIEKL